MKTCHLARFLLFSLLFFSLTACSAKSPTQPARIYEGTGFTKPGSYRLQSLLDGRGTLTDHLLREKTRNPALRDVDITALHKFFQKAYAQLYLPVQPGTPLCHLASNFRHCNGIELLADFHVYTDDTIVLHSSVLYHVNIRLEKDQPNFFRAIKTQRDRGDFALPRHYYAGDLAKAIQEALPILQEIATDYRKYIKTGDREIEIALTLEVAREKGQTIKADLDREDAAGLSTGILLSAVPNIALLTRLTVSALTTGGRTFWNVLEEEKEFDLYKRALALDQVEYSYGKSMARNAFRTIHRLSEPSPDILLRDLKIRLRPQKSQAPPPILSEALSHDGRHE